MRAFSNFLLFLCVHVYIQTDIHTKIRIKTCLDTCKQASSFLPMLVWQVWSVETEWRLENLPSEWLLLSISRLSEFQDDKQNNQCSVQGKPYSHLLHSCNCNYTTNSCNYITHRMPVIHNARILSYYLCYFLPCSTVWGFFCILPTLSVDCFCKQ